jgi:hypothetical protein
MDYNLMGNMFELPVIANHIINFSNFKVNNNNKYKEVMNATDLVILIHRVLEFIEECDVNLVYCDKQSIIEDLEAINENFLKLDIKDISNDSNELTYDVLYGDIIVECLQNAGKFIYMPHQKLRTPMIVLLDTERAKDKTYYRLSKQALKYIYIIKEVEDIKDLDYDAFTLSRSFASGNYQKAEITTKRIITKLTLADREISEIKRNLNVDYIYYKNTISSTIINEKLDTINDQRSEFNKIKTKIMEHIAKIESSEHSDVNEETRNQLATIDTNMKRILNLIFKLHESTLDLANNLKELEWSTFGLGIKSSLSINQDILCRIEEDILKYKNCDQFIKMLSNPIRTSISGECNKLFNLDILIEPQEKIILKSNEKNSGAKAENFDEDEIIEKIDNIEDKNNNYISMILELFAFICDTDNKEITISEIVSLEEKRDLKIITKNLRQLRNLLIYFDRKELIELSKMKNGTDMKRHEQILFGNAVMEFLEKYPSFKHCTLYIKEGNEKEIKISDHKEVLILQNDIYFKLEEK